MSFDLRRSLSQVLVKPAGADCNLRCDYCFYLEKQALYAEQKRRMPLPVLDRLVWQMMRGGASAVSFCWQGGEPTLLGRDFFEQVVDRQKRYGLPGQTVANSLQTNGLKLDDRFCEFLARYQFLVGLSVDGPPDVHDAYRHDGGGHGSFARSAAAVQRLLSHGVATNALVVITDRSVGRAADIWQSLLDLGLRHFQFIPCLEWDCARPSRWASYGVPPEALGDLLCEWFDLWLSSFCDGRPTVFVRWFDALLFGYADLPTPLCTLQPRCGDNLVVEHNGDVYACDFYVTPEWRLGNVLHDALPELAQGWRQQQFGARKARLHEDCLTCTWLPRCHGGCPKDRDRHPDGQWLDPFCPAYRRFFAHADARLRQLAKPWRRR